MIWNLVSRSNTGVVSIIVTAMFLTTLHAAAFIAEFRGFTTVTSDKTAVRKEYPDGRIVDTAKRGLVMTVTYGAGDGTGMWLYVKYKSGTKDIEGFVDHHQTSFVEDLESGRLVDCGDQKKKKTDTRCRPPKS